MTSKMSRLRASRSSFLNSSEYLNPFPMGSDSGEFWWRIARLS